MCLCRARADLTSVLTNNEAMRAAGCHSALVQWLTVAVFMRPSTVSQRDCHWAEGLMFQVVSIPKTLAIVELSLSSHLEQIG